MFNKDKYLEYVEFRDTKLIIYNKWSLLEDNGWYLTTITSTGEMFQRELSIADGKLEEAKQLFTQDVKTMYNRAFDCDYEIINVFPDQPEPKGYREAADKYTAGYKEDEPHINLFSFLVAMNKFDETKGEEDTNYVSPKDEVYDFSHIPTEEEMKNSTIDLTKFFKKPQ